MPVIWDKKFELGVPEIDGQHRQFIDILNHLYQLLSNNPSQEQFLQVFDQLENYVQDHFSLEEKIISSLDHSYVQEHLKQHSYFAQNLDQLKKDFQSNNYATSLELVDFLESWLVDHLANFDKKYISTLKNAK